MAEQVAAPKPAAKKVKANPPAHPSYQEMVSAAITSLKERGGSSRLAIQKHIMVTFNVGSDEKVVITHLRKALKKMIEMKQVIQPKGKGLTGSFKLAETKPIIKKASKPKTVTKPKSPTKTAKKTVKKVAPKKLEAAAGDAAPPAATKKPKAKKSSKPLGSPKKPKMNKPKAAPKKTKPATKPKATKKAAKA